MTVAALPQNRVVIPGEQLQAFDSVTNFSNARQSGGSGDSYGLDTTYVREGSSSIRLTTPTNNTYWGELLIPAYSKTVYNRQVGVWVYIPDHTKIDSIIIYAAKESGYTNFITFTYRLMLSSGNHNRFDGWHFIETNPGGWASGGGTVGTGVDTWAAMKFRVTPSSGNSGVSVYFDDLWINRRARAAVLITADDGYASFETRGLPILDAAGFKVTLSIPAVNIDTTATWMTTAGLQSAAADGHAIITHGATNLTTLTLSEAIADILENQDFLVSIGLGQDRHHYVLPNGGYDSTVKQALIATNCISARGVVKPVAVPISAGFGDRRYYYNIIGGEQSDTPTALLGYVDTAVTDGQTAVLMFHDIVASGASAAIEYNEANFQTLVDGLVRRYRNGLIDVMTVPNWYLSLTQPALVAA